MLKNKDFKRLSMLYLSYHLNKTTIIVLAIVLAIWGLVLYINTGFPLEMESYLAAPKSFHTNYLEQSIFFLELIDGVLVSFLVGAELSTLSLFDPMFVTNVSRIKIIFCKILANGIILVTLLFFQISMLYFIGLIAFPNYTIQIYDLLLVGYVALPMIELLLVGEFLSILIHSYFIPILIFILHILTIFLFKIDELSQVLSLFIPSIEFSCQQFVLKGNLFMYCGICVLLGIFTALLFQKKDISNA